MTIPLPVPDNREVGIVVALVIPTTNTPPPRACVALPICVPLVVIPAFPTPPGRKLIAAVLPEVILTLAFVLEALLILMLLPAVTLTAEVVLPMVRVFPESSVAMTRSAVFAAFLASIDE